MTISATQIADLVQNLVDAKTRMHELASDVVQLTGCETCYDASHYKNRAMWVKMPKLPTLEGCVTPQEVTGCNLEQKAFKQSVNLLLEDVADAQNDYDHAMQDLREWVHTLPETTTELYFYVIYGEAVYKIGYKHVHNIFYNKREPTFEQDEEMEC